MIDNPNIPIVGQAFKPVLWYPTAIAACLCKPGALTLIVLTHFHQPNACTLCGKHYAISGMNEHGAVISLMSEITPGRA